MDLQDLHHKYTDLYLYIDIYWHTDIYRYTDKYNWMHICFILKTNLKFGISCLVSMENKVENRDCLFTFASGKTIKIY